jgi:hypothetical protein
MQQWAADGDHDLWDILNSSALRILGNTDGGWPDAKARDSLTDKVDKEYLHIIDPIRQRLVKKEIGAMAMFEDGAMQDLEDFHWSSPSAVATFTTGQTLLYRSGSPAPYPQQCWVYLNQEGLLQPTREKMAQAQYHVNDIKVSPAIFPYLHFMIQASESLAQNRTTRTPKKEQTEDWLGENWPSETLGKPSNAKVGYMATFLRHPNDELGGNKKFP